MSETASAMLVLEDGSTFVGESLGATGEFVGEIVFNTSVTGYQEIITDPSYWGQMVTFTCPHIGNVGVNAVDNESYRPYVRAVIARQISAIPSNWRSEQPLPEYLREHGIPALSGVDTRRITLTIREHGVMRAALSTVNLNADRLLEMARTSPDMSELSPVDEVTLRAPRPWDDPVPLEWDPCPDLRKAPDSEAPLIVVVDCGTKHNILRHLATLGARVMVVPARSTAEEVLSYNPDGILLSNGPGDPVQVPKTVQTARELMGIKPLFGICLGHQIIGLAVGARTYKLPFGHHGSNHPVQDLTTGAIEITAQNHNYAIDADSLAGLPLEITRINLYDDTVEGLRHSDLPVWSVQYHPEASPGPHDSLHELREFVEAARAARSGQ